MKGLAELTTYPVKQLGEPLSLGGRSPHNKQNKYKNNMEFIILVFLFSIDVDIYSC